MKIDRTAFNKLLSMLTGVDRQVLDRIGGSLRKAGMVSVGGRGINSPHITPEDVKNILLGLMGTDNASRAAEAVKILTELKSDTGKKAGDAIVQLLTDPSYRKDLSAIHVTRNYPEVVIYWGLEENPESQREEIFTADGNLLQFQTKAILDGRVVILIVSQNQWINDQLDQIRAGQ